MSYNEPLRNGCEVIYEIFHMLNSGFEILLAFWTFHNSGLLAKLVLSYLTEKKNNLLLKLYPISQHDIRIVRLLIKSCVKK